MNAGRRLRAVFVRLWRWIVLLAILGLLTAVVVSALEGTNFQIILYGALSVLLCAVLVVFG